MRLALSFLAGLAVASLLWLFIARSDGVIIEAKNAQLYTLLDAAHTKDILLSQNGILIDSRNDTIKALKEKIRTAEATEAKDQELPNSAKALHQCSRFAPKKFQYRQT